MLELIDRLLTPKPADIYQLMQHLKPALAADRFCLEAEITSPKVIQNWALLLVAEVEGEVAEYGLHQSGSPILGPRGNTGQRHNAVIWELSRSFLKKAGWRVTVREEFRRWGCATDDARLKLKKLYPSIQG